MDDDTLQRRLDALERRLSRIEAAMPLAPPDAEPARTSLTPPAAVRFPTEPPDTPPLFPTPTPREASLEHTIGLVWAGWVGAIAVAVAAGLGIKFAYDHGWFALVTPAVRLAMLTAVAVTLIAAGEGVYRRISPTSAVGFFAAGVAVLFLTAYAGHAYYGLYGPGMAWWLMGGSSLVGAAIARRGHLVSIAVLSLIGGDLAPLLLGITPASPGPFLGYLLMLQAMALLLAAGAGVRLRPPLLPGEGWGEGDFERKTILGTPNHPQPNPLPEGEGTRARLQSGGAKWTVLRGVALAGTAAWTFFALQSPSFLGWAGTVVFMLLSAGLYQAELLATTARTRDRSAPPALGADFSLAVTAALTAGFLLYFRDAAPGVRTAGVLALATTTGLLAAVLRGRGAALRPLAIGFAVQAAALVAVAVPVALSGLWIAAAWAALAVAFGVLARRLRLPRAAVFAIAVWSLAVADAYVWTAGVAATDAPAHLEVVWLHLWGRAVPAYVVMATLLWAAGHAVAWLIDTPGVSPKIGRRDGATAVTVLADVVLLAILTGLPPLGATALLAAAAVALASVPTVLAPPLLPHATVLWMLAAADWLSVGTLVPRLWFGRPPAEYLPLLNPMTADAALLLASGGWLARRARRTQPPALPAIVGTCLAVLLWAGSLEIDRAFSRGGVGRLNDPALAEQVALSVFWSIFSVAAVIAGFARTVPGLRYFGLGLFAVTGVKVVVVDLAQVSTGYRILSFLALGLLLLGTSVLYGRGTQKSGN